MRRRAAPYGYRIENGTAVICEEEAAQVRMIYKEYLGGASLENAALKAGLVKSHANVKKMLKDPHYLGDDFYPPIIDKETFDAFDVERVRREKALGRDNRQRRPVEALPAPTSFKMGEPKETIRDPYKRAEYLYRLIESEV